MTTTLFPVETRTLDNGLRVVVSEDHVAPVVAVNLWYDVGSRHEQPGRTGLAHLFEHLMFEGSRQVAAGEHFTVISTAGGSNNATTSTERTNYFEKLPAEQLDAALWLEADRLGSLLDALTQESLDKQRDIVRNERRQRYDNVPYGDAVEKLCRLLFPPDHPYAHQPIGSMEDLAAADLEDVRAFFRTYYAPNNAVLTVAGDVDSEHAFERAEHFFGSIPAQPHIPPPVPGLLPTPLATETREHVVANVPDRLAFTGFRLPPEGDPRLDHVEVAFAVLATGRGSALYRGLVQTELAKQATAFVDRRVSGASLGAVVTMAHADVPLDKLEAALRTELARLAEDGPTEQELERAKAMLEVGWLNRVSGLEGRADELSRHTLLFGDPTRVNRKLVPLMATTAADVAAAVDSFLVNANPAVVTYEPALEPGGAR